MNVPEKKMANFPARKWFDSVFHDFSERKKRSDRNKKIQKWVRRGRPVPPPDAIKHNTLKAYSERYGLRVFVETGTLFGDTVDAVKGCFDRLYSIELSDTLFEKASERFKDDDRVTIIHGDSGKQLGVLMKSIDRPALFWLDGHYSAGVTARGEKDTPIVEELENIARSAERHVIIIDDVHCFGTDPAYPTVDELTKHIHSIMAHVDISIEDDSMRIVPN